MKKNLKIFLFLFLIVLLPFILVGTFLLEKKLEDYFYAQISAPFQNMIFIEPPPKKPPLEIDAKAVLSLKFDKKGKEKILFKKNPDLVLPIASLTKLMTALIVFENYQNYDLSKYVTISQNAANQEDVLYDNLKAGEKKKIEELLDLILIYSSNDAAFALAEIIGVDNFIKKMNDKARELGLENTYFANPTGLDFPKTTFTFETKEYFNYSTVYDLAKLAQYILQTKSQIFEISSKERTSLVKDGIFDIFSPQWEISGKTGYTSEAGGCMLVVLKKDNVYIINIILGTNSTQSRVKEMQKLIDWLGI